MQLVGFRCGIGNFLVFSSALQALAHMDSELHLALDQSWQGPARDSIEMMARKMPFIKEIVNYSPGDDLSRYDHIYISRHSHLNSDLYRAIYNNPALVAPKLPLWAESYQHERDYYLEEITSLVDTQARIFPQYMPVADSFPYEMPHRPYIIVANGWRRTESNFWQRKEWPHFAEFINTFLFCYLEMGLCIVGGEEDQKWAENLEIFPTFRLKNRVHDLSGQLNILETAYLVQRARLVITNDSLVAHLSDCLKKQGVILFGPTLVSKNGPLNGTIETIRSPLPCAPCQGTYLGQTCEEWGKCMKLISVGLVMSFVKRLLT